MIRFRRKIKYGGACALPPARAASVPSGDSTGSAHILSPHRHNEGGGRMSEDVRESALEYHHRLRRPSRSPYKPTTKPLANQARSRAPPIRPRSPRPPVHPSSPTSWRASILTARANLVGVSPTAPRCWGWAPSGPPRRKALSLKARRCCVKKLRQIDSFDNIEINELDPDKPRQSSPR